MKYNFVLSEFHPIVKVELEANGSLFFWYQGEDLDAPPGKYEDDPTGSEPWQFIMRPALKGKAVKIYRENGEEACIRHINARIANHILDEYEKVRDECPVALEKRYLAKIDEFYHWFWIRRSGSDSRLFSRFLRHIHSVRQKHNLPPNWYTLKEASVYTRIGVTKLRELKDKGKVKGYRLDDTKSKSTILFHRKDLDALILFNKSAGLNARQQSTLKAYEK